MSDHRALAETIVGIVGGNIESIDTGVRVVVDRYDGTDRPNNEVRIDIDDSGVRFAGMRSNRVHAIQGKLDPLINPPRQRSTMPGEIEKTAKR